MTKEDEADVLRLLKNVDVTELMNMLKEYDEAGQGRDWCVSL